MTHLRFLILSLALALLLLGAYVSTGKRAECGFCSTISCTKSKQCGGESCVCLKRGYDIFGKCYSVE